MLKRLRAPPPTMPTHYPAPLVLTSSKEAPVNAHAGSSRVLVIEDHPFQRRTLAHKLNGLGVPRVLEAASGPDALELVRANGGSIALILSSLDMPERDSLELLHTLASVAPQIAVAVLSAFDRADLRRIAAEASASGLHLIGMLEKPASDDALRAVLVRALADAGGGRMLCAAGSAC